MVNPIFLSTREAAAALRVSVRTVQRWAKLGKLDAVKDTAGRWIISLQVDLAGFKPVQVDKARELLEQGGIVPTSRPRLFLAVSSDGVVHYLVDQAERSCTCKAGGRGLLCYHVLAADILVATAPVGRAA